MESEERLRKLESYTRNEKERYFFLSLFFKGGDNDEKKNTEEKEKRGPKMLRFRETRSKPDVNLAFPERKENGDVEGEKKMGKEEEESTSALWQEKVEQYCELIGP